MRFTALKSASFFIYFSLSSSFKSDNVIVDINVILKKSKCAVKLFFNIVAYTSISELLRYGAIETHSINGDVFSEYDLHTECQLFVTDVLDISLHVAVIGNTEHGYLSALKVEESVFALNSRLLVLKHIFFKVLLNGRSDSVTSVEVEQTSHQPFLGKRSLCFKHIADDLKHTVLTLCLNGSYVHSSVLRELEVLFLRLDSEIGVIDIHVSCGQGLILNCIADSAKELFLLSLLVLEPVARPDTVVSPAHIFKHGLSESVSVSGVLGGVVRRAVTLYCDEVVEGVGVLNCNINLEGRAAYLGICGITVLLKELAHLHVKLGGSVSHYGLSIITFKGVNTKLCIREVVTQISDADGIGMREVKLRTVQRGYELNVVLCSGHRYVKTALTALLVKGTEIVEELAL